MAVQAIWAALAKMAAAAGKGVVKGAVKGGAKSLATKAIGTAAASKGATTSSAGLSAMGGGNASVGAAQGGGLTEGLAPVSPSNAANLTIEGPMKEFSRVIDPSQTLGGSTPSQGADLVQMDKTPGKFTMKGKLADTSTRNLGSALGESKSMTMQELQKGDLDLSRLTVDQSGAEPWTRQPQAPSETMAERTWGQKFGDDMKGAISDAYGQWRDQPGKQAMKKLMSMRGSPAAQSKAREFDDPLRGWQPQPRRKGLAKRTRPTAAPVHGSATMRQFGGPRGFTESWNRR